MCSLAHANLGLEVQTMIADSITDMNFSPDATNLRAEAIELAALLKGGMADLFRQRLAVVVERLGQNRVQTLVPMVNECLGQSAAHRIELSNCGNADNATVDVITHSRFFGNCWPVRYTVMKVGHANH